MTSLRFGPLRTDAPPVSRQHGLSSAQGAGDPDRTHLPRAGAGGRRGHTGRWAAGRRPAPAGASVIWVGPAPAAPTGQRADLAHPAQRPAAGAPLVYPPLAGKLP